MLLTAQRPWLIYRLRQRLLFLIILFFVGVTANADRNVVSILMEPIKSEFAVSDGMLGMLTGIAFTFFYVVFGIPISRWSDRGDRVRIITLALIIWSAMTALCGLAGTFWQLLVARMGVGAGEGGCMPTGQSLIVDYFPPETRGRAMAGFLMSTTVGSVLGLIAGGWLAQHYGWRVTLIALGSPGLLLAMVTSVFLKEPRRQQIDRVKTPETALAAVRILLTKQTYLFLLLGLMLYYLVLQGALLFIPSFLIRAHNTGLSQAGLFYGTASGACALIGFPLGGWLADILAKRNRAWLARLPAIACIAAFPVYETAFVTADLRSAVLLFGFGIFLLSTGMPATLAATHSVAGAHRRATAITLVLACTSLVSQGFGAVMTGYLSDALRGAYGPANGLRYALVFVVMLFLPSAVLFWRASRTIVSDQES